MNTAKKQKKTIERKRLEISSGNLEIPREYFMQRWAQKKDRNSMELTETEYIKKRWQGLHRRTIQKRS